MDIVVDNFTYLTDTNSLIVDFHQNGICGKCFMGVLDFTENELANIKAGNLNAAEEVIKREISKIDLSKRPFLDEASSTMQRIFRMIDQDLDLAETQIDCGYYLLNSDNDKQYFEKTFGKSLHDGFEDIQADVEKFHLQKWVSFPEHDIEYESPVLAGDTPEMIFCVEPGILNAFSIRERTRILDPAATKNQAKEDLKQLKDIFGKYNRNQLVKLFQEYTASQRQGNSNFVSPGEWITKKAEKAKGFGR